MKYSSLLPLVLLLTYVGMRLNEALSLRWRDVDLKKGNIRIKAKKTFRGRILLLITDPAVKISETFLDILRIWKLKSGDSEFVLPMNGKTKPIFSKWTWLRFKKEANLENNTPQSFRSTFVSYTLSWGVPLPVLSRWTGHSLVVIDKHYFDVV